MGLDGYEVCPVYRYNARLDRYEVSSIAPVYFSDPGYFRSTQVVHYMEDLVWYGRVSESPRRGPDYRMGPAVSSSLYHAEEVWQDLVDIQFSPYRTDG